MKLLLIHECPAEFSSTFHPIMLSRVAYFPSVPSFYHDLLHTPQANIESYDSDDQKMSQISVSDLLRNVSFSVDQTSPVC